MSTQLTLGDERKADQAELRGKLQNLAREMLLEDAAGPVAKTHGVTFDQVRLRAETRGWLTGEEKGRTLSFGAAVMKAAGGVPCEFRASKHRNSHGRLIRVFRLAVVASG